MRISVLAAALALGPIAPAAAAAADPDPMATVYACAEIADAGARLACFDKEVGALKAQQAQGAFAAIDVKRAEIITRDAFGFSIPSLPRLKLPTFSGGEIKAQTMTIERVDGSGPRAAFRMSNGQVWRQIDTDRNRGVRAGAEVSIEKASMGSFLLVPKSGGIGLRVRREQ
jgi:hypothetical protein